MSHLHKPALLKHAFLYCTYPYHSTALHQQGWVVPHWTCTSLCNICRRYLLLSSSYTCCFFISFYVSLPLSLLMMMTSIHHIYPLASHSHATNMLLEFAAVMQDNDKLGLKSLVQIFGMPYSSSYLISCYSHCLLRKNEEQISQTTRSKEGYRGTRRESRSLQQSAPRLLFICQHPDV